MGPSQQLLHNSTHDGIRLDRESFSVPRPGGCSEIHEEPLDLSNLTAPPLAAIQSFSNDPSSSRKVLKIVRPASHIDVSNPGPPNAVYFINGMNNDRCSAHNQAVTVANTVGREVRLIHNYQEYPPLAIFKCVCGIFSSTLGSLFKNEETETLKRDLKEQLKAGKEIHIFSHSQGTIILNNALDELRDEVLSDKSISKAERAERWRSMASHINVTFCGIGIRDWPAELKSVRGFSHEDDLITFSTRCLSFIKRTRDWLFSWVYDIRRRNVEIQTVKGSSHLLQDYLRSYPQFFVAESRRQNGALDVRDLAQRVYTAAALGQYSDRTVHSLLGASMAEGGDGFRREFARLLKRQADGRLNPFIGNFDVGEALLARLEERRRPSRKTLTKRTSLQQWKSPSLSANISLSV